LLTRTGALHHVPPQGADPVTATALVQTDPTGAFECSSQPPPSGCCDDRLNPSFVNHDLASYEVPVHADIPHQEVIFLDGVDPMSSPMKAKGVGELGICGVGAAVANAIYNATGVRVRDYPVTLDKLLDRLPEVG
jgi:hypothetical protein